MSKLLRKNTFKIDKLKTTKAFKSLEICDKINWECDVTIEDFFKELNSGEEEPVHEDYVDYKVVGTLALESGTAYLICDPEYKTIGFCMEHSQPLFWFVFRTKKLFYNHIDRYYNTYNVQDYPIEFNSWTRGFSGTVRMLGAKITDLQNYLINNRYTEFFTWGSAYDDYPFRDADLSTMTPKEIQVMHASAMKQKDDTNYCVNIRTKYSRSIITFIDYNGAFVSEIQYNSTTTPGVRQINEVLEKEFPEDIPLDVVLTLLYLPFTTHTGLLKLTPLNQDNFMMANLVANNNEMYQELIDMMVDIQPTLEGDETQEAGHTFVKKLETNIIVNDILSDGDFNQFVESLLDRLSSDKRCLDFVKVDLRDFIEDRVDDQGVADYLIKLVTDIILFKINFNGYSKEHE